MAITKMNEVLAAIQAGRTNDEIRDEIDGWLSDKRIDTLREHPAVRGGSDMKANDRSDRDEIAREVGKIFSTGITADEIKAAEIKPLAAAEALSQIEVRAGCDLSTDRPQRMTSVTQDAGCDLKCPTCEQREASYPSYLSDAWAEKQAKTTRLKTVGVSLEGLLNYYVDKDGISIEADDVLIEADQMDELLAELNEVRSRQRGLMEAE